MASHLYYSYNALYDDRYDSCLDIPIDDSSIYSGKPNRNALTDQSSQVIRGTTPSYRLTKILGAGLVRLMLDGCNPIA
jgi:hypothetical protein